MYRRCFSLAVWGLVITISGVETIVAQDSKVERDEISSAKTVPATSRLTFGEGLDSHWEFLDDGWSLVAEKEGQAGYLSLHKKASNYSPKFRSPTHLAIWKTPIGTEYSIDVRVRSTHPDYAHRDVVLVLGYQNPNQYYYVHLAKKTDDHANQIFIVNHADRIKISLETTSGTDWDDKWHTVRVIRSTKTGEIKVFYDDLSKPVMVAKDQTFGAGRIGLGSFDDTADFEWIEIADSLGNPSK